MYTKIFCSPDPSSPHTAANLTSLQCSGTKEKFKTLIQIINQFYSFFIFSLREKRQLKEKAAKTNWSNGDS